MLCNSFFAFYFVQFYFSPKSAFIAFLFPHNFLLRFSFSCFPSHTLHFISKHKCFFVFLYEFFHFYITLFSIKTSIFPPSAHLFSYNSLLCFFNLISLFQIFLLHIYSFCCILILSNFKTNRTRRTFHMKEKVILAYSGGLDTTAIIHGSKKILIMSHLLLHRLRTGRRTGRLRRTRKIIRRFQIIY